MTPLEKRVYGLLVILMVMAGGVFVYSQTPPGPNTTQHGQGINYPTVTSQYGYFYGTPPVNITNQLFGDFGAYDIETTGDITGATVDAQEFFLNAVNKTDVLAYPVTEASYVVWVDNSTGTPFYYAKNGTTGTIDYSGADAAMVINATKDVLTSGRIVLKEIEIPSNIEMKENIIIEEILNGVSLCYTKPTIEDLFSRGTYFNTFEKYNGFLYGIRAPPDYLAVSFKRSADGVNFEDFCIALPPDDVGLYLRILFAKGNIVLPTRMGEVYTSTDNTATWNLALTHANAQFYYWSAAVDEMGNIYLATYGAPAVPTVYKSVDGGVTWDTIFTAAVTHFHEIAIDPYTGYIWLSSGDAIEAWNIYRSIDGGGSFQLITSALKVTAIEFTERYVIFGTDETGNNRIVLYEKATGTSTVSFVFPTEYNWAAVYEIKRTSNGVFYARMVQYTPTRCTLWMSRDLYKWYLAYENPYVTLDYYAEFLGYMFFSTHIRLQIETIPPILTITPITKNGGTATILNTTTSIIVNHGCSYIPSAFHVTLTLTNNPTNDPGNLYIDTFTATQMTIRCRNDPGATGAIIAWAVRRTP